MDRFGELYRQNGYLTPPYDIYEGFLRLVDQAGRIVDLGCGNGMLLRYLLDHSPHALTPFGLDLDPRCISIARSSVFPEFAGNFFVGDLRNVNFIGSPFQTVLANPVCANPAFYEQNDGRTKYLYRDSSIYRFVRDCYQQVGAGGRLILFCYEEEVRGIPDFASIINHEMRELDVIEHTSSLDRVKFWVCRK